MVNPSPKPSLGPAWKTVGTGKTKHHFDLRKLIAARFAELSEKRAAT